MSGLEESEICSQYFLEPVMFELSSIVDEQLREIMPLLIKLGFQVREFGPRSYLLEALPMIVKHMDPKEALLSALEQDADDEIFAQEKTKATISKICKKAAVKAGQVLTAEEQERLIRDLEDCEAPRTWPNGRPTMIHLSVDLLERQFGRRGSI
jgi:DNA mismatch repair protein MutL